MHVTLDLALCFLTCLLLRVSYQCTNYGYPFENHLGTFAPYRTVSNKSFEKIEFEGCTPRKIWMLIRHGTRNPKYSVIEQMNSRLPQIKKLLIDSKNLPNEFIKNRDIDLLNKWKINLDPDDKNKLTHEGEEEMLILAERMQSRFPELFDEIYSNTSYKFKYTHTQRTKRSAYSFASGIFGRATAKDVWFPEPLRKDPILRFYKLCDRWHLEVKKNPASEEELRIFENGPEMEALVKEVNTRLNLKETILDLGTCLGNVDTFFRDFLVLRWRPLVIKPINTEEEYKKFKWPQKRDVSTLSKQVPTKKRNDIKLMYDMCAFETAWNKKSKSPWCAVFSLDNFKVLEYAKDLKYYWRDGYGYDLTYKQACPAFKDMFNFLQNKNRFPRVIAYFTHSGTILKMLAHLGLYKDDEHLTAKNYDNMVDRQWRTSKIDTFGSNLAFVLYGCGSENKILFLHQENIVRLPPCPDSDLCDINAVRDHYFQSLSCDFSSMCLIPQKQP